MKKENLLFGCIALPDLVMAQAPVADPRLAVPAVLYRSVFADKLAGVRTLAVDRKAANAEIGQFKNGHVDILKREAARKPGATI